MAQAQFEDADPVAEISYRRAQMDDMSLQTGRNGAVLGAIIGLVLGLTVWHSWLIVAIVLSFYGALIGAVGGGAVGVLSSRR